LSFQDTAETTAEPEPAQDDAVDPSDGGGLVNSPTRGSTDGSRDGTGRTVVEARDLYVWDGDTRVISDISIAVPDRGDRTHRALRLRDVVVPPVYHPDERPRRVRPRRGPAPVPRQERVDDVDPVALRRTVGVVFQEPNPFPESIYDNVAYGLEVPGFDGDVEDRVERALKDAALWEEVKDQLDESGLDLSGGQQQRLCIAGAIAADPDVVLIEEPSSVLDPIATSKTPRSVRPRPRRRGASALDPVATSTIEDLTDDLATVYTVVIVIQTCSRPPACPTGPPFS